MISRRRQESVETSFLQMRRSIPSEGKRSRQYLEFVFVFERTLQNIVTLLLLAF